MIPDQLAQFLLGVAGAMCVQIVRLYEQRGKLSSETFQAVLKSRLHWTVMIGMFLMSGLVTWAIHGGCSCATNSQLIMTGAGAKAIFQQFTATRIATRPPTLGSERDRLTNRDIFL